MRRGEIHSHPSLTRNYVTPSESRREHASRYSPLVYPGGFSPVRTSSHRPTRNDISPPAASRGCDDNLYASFSPPRQLPQAGLQTRGSMRGNLSIFRPKQVSVIVARDSSNDDSSSFTCGSKIASPESHVRSKEFTVARCSVSAFPAKLHAILSKPEFQGSISWLPHGRAWRVLKPKTFEEKIIPNFFRSSKYASFMRQVNGWGFRRITTPGPDFNGYWHPLFLRNLPSLCDRMKRPQKNDPELKLEDPPDFYRVSKFSALPGPEQRSEHQVTQVGHSSSISSSSYAPLSKEHGEASPRADETDSGHFGIPTLASGDRNDQHDRTKVAINLSDVYDKEASRSGPNQLSEADLHYLVQQNRALIKQAHLQHSRPRNSDGSVH